MAYGTMHGGAKRAAQLVVTRKRPGEGEDLILVQGRKQLLETVDAPIDID